jgi:hypothetical protein
MQSAEMPDWGVMGGAVDADPEDAGPLGSGGGTGGLPFGSGGAVGSGGAISAMDASQIDGSPGTGGMTGSVDAPNDSGGSGGSGGSDGSGGSCGSLNDGLVGYWKLDEGKTPIIDSSGSGNNGTLINSPTWAPGPHLTCSNLNALALNGTNQYASLGNPAVLNFSGRITLSAWVRPSSSGGVQNLLAHGYDANHEVFLRIASPNYEVGSWVAGTTYSTIYAVPGGDIGTWVHLAGVYDGTGWHLYRNGVQVSSSVKTVGAVTVTSNWAIGARGDGTSRLLAGVIDEVRIYKRALSAAEIADLYP